MFHVDHVDQLLPEQFVITQFQLLQWHLETLGIWLKQSQSQRHAMRNILRVPPREIASLLHQTPHNLANMITWFAFKPTHLQAFHK